MGDRRGGAPVVRREPLPPGVERGKAVHRPRFEDLGGRHRRDACGGVGLRRRDRPGHDGAGAARQRHVQLSSGPGHGKGAGADLLWKRGGRVEVRVGVLAHEPGRFRGDHSAVEADARRDRSPRPAPRAGHLPRRVAEVVRDRSRRSQPRSVVAAARTGRFRRGDQNAAVRHAHVRESGERGRRHQLLRSQAASQHLAVCVEAKTADARALLQRR